MNGLKMRHMMVAGAVLLMSTGALAFAPGHSGHGAGGPCMGGSPGMGCGSMGAGPGWRAQALGLSADQQKQVSALQSRFDADVAPVHAQMAAKRSELQALWSAPAPDRRAILAKQAEMEPLREKIRTAQVDFQLAVQKVLTPEQREAWTNMRGPGHCRGGQGPGGGGFGGNEMPCGGSVPQSW